MNDPRAEAEEALLADTLREAYGKGSPCPPPALFLEEDLLGEAERRALDQHVSTCPACTSERELARSFLTSEGETVGAPEEVDALLATLRGARTPGAAQGRARRRWFASPSGPVPLALAASVLLAAVVVIGGLRTPSAPPELPTFEESVLRGAGVELLSPEGQLVALPKNFTWRTVTEATSYRVTVIAVDDRVLWSGEATTSPLPLPTVLREQLSPAVRYRWQVEALGPAGSVAISPLVDFRIDPRYELGQEGHR